MSTPVNPTANKLVQMHWENLHMLQSLYFQLLDGLTDADLAFRLPGANPTLGALCREMGETTVSYLQSFRTLKQEFTYRANLAQTDTVAELRKWVQGLNAEMDEVLAAFTDTDIEGKLVDRGGWSVPVGINFHIYREALLIFYGKASVYLKAMNKPFTEQWRTWIA